MSILVECEQCGTKRKVNERLSGRTIRCPGCEQPLTIPTLAPVAEAVEVAHESATNTPDINTPDINTAVKVEPSYIPDVPANTPAVSASPTKLRDDDEPKRPPRDDEDDDLVPPRKKREDGELDMTPMVDVTFLLLIFFMVTASFSLQKSIQMPRQSSDLPSMSNVEEETEELDPIELEIDESGAFLVLAPEWERETPGKQNLITALKEAIGDNRDGMKLDIKVHENAKLQMLVDGMDAGTIAGFTQLQVTEVDGFD